MTITIEEGKFYDCSCGQKNVGPMHHDGDGRWFAYGENLRYDNNGRATNGLLDSHHLVAEAAAPVEDDGLVTREAPGWVQQVEAEAAEERVDAVIEAAVAATAAKHALPDNNPKTAVGRAKPPLHAIPPTALLHLGLAMEDGEHKYGLFNWRDRDVSSSVYYDAALRHLMAWWDGEQVATDSKVHHLGHVMACCAILLDAEATGNLNDDRGLAGRFSLIVEQMRQERLSNSA